MKYAMLVLVGLALLLMAEGAGAAPVVVFADDVEGDPLGEGPVADIGTYQDANGRVTDAATAGIPANPSGGSQFVLISRSVGYPIVGWATEVAGAGGGVHLEFDMYVPGNGAGTTYADFQMLTQDYPGGHILDGLAPHIRVADTASYPTLDVQNMWNDSPTWHVDPLGPTVPADEWHHYAVDYVIGDVNSMFIAVDGGTAVNIPPPWGWLAYGDPDSDPNARTPLQEIQGVMFRPPGNAPYYGDNIELTFDIPVLGISRFDVTTGRLLEFDSESNLVYELQSALPPQTDVWAAVGLTVTGTGSTVFAFDPAEPDGSATQKVYRALEIR